MDLAEKAATQYGSGVTLGPLIHNSQAVAHLAERGLREVGEIDEVQSGELVMLRTHGTAPDIHEALAHKGARIVDTTCPFVSRAQNEAKRLVAEGYQVFILGERDHPEARAIRDHTGGKATIIEGFHELADHILRPHVGVICQTTQRLDKLEALVKYLLPRIQRLSIANTICDATSKRQEASLEVARIVDLMIVIWGHQSANTRRLAEICAETGTPTHHVETAEEIEPQWLEGVRRLGITAGASTPDWTIEAVVARLKELSG